MTRSRKAPPAPTPPEGDYALEQLHVDQDSNLVIDAIPAVLAWVPGKSRAKATQPFRFEVEHSTPATATRTVSIALRWDITALEARDPTVARRAERLRTGQTVQREHVTELAAYGLSFVAISLLMPGIRVISMRKGLPPDLLFDVTPGQLRGVEVAGRATGGMRALREIRSGTPSTDTRAASPGKAVQLRARADILEAHLSLWCASPRVAIMEQVKP